MTSWGSPSPAECLELLKRKLDDGRYVFILVTGDRHPHLHVTSRDATQLTEDIYCDGRYFWWSWAERIGPVTDVARAAQAVRTVLACLTGASR